jgi:hypothetical protein
MKVSLATEMAPPFVLVAHYFIAGVAFLLLSGFSLAFVSEATQGYFISTALASFSHLYLLGFVLMVIFGALYQLLPVVLEAPIFSKDFAYIQFYMYVLGVSMMVSGFTWTALHLLIPYGAVLTYVSMLIFCVNVFLTFYRLERFGLVAKFLWVATFFLCVSISIGLVVGLHLGHGLFDINSDAWVRAHMLGTLGGFVMMVIMGIAMVLLPMFSLAHGYSQQWIHSALYIHTLGVLGAMLCMLMGYDRFLLLPLGLLMLSCALFVIQMLSILKHRVRKQNDYWVKNILFALLCFTSSLVAVWFDVLLGGILFFLGFLLPLIVGHIYKILPFLIWYEKFSPYVGKQKVPLLHQMIHTKIADIQTLILFGAVGTIALAHTIASQALFYLGCASLLMSIVLVVYNVFYTFNYTLKD